MGGPSNASLDMGPRLLGVDVLGMPQPVSRMSYVPLLQLTYKITSQML